MAKLRVRPSSLGAIRDRLTVARLGELGAIPVAQLSTEEVASWQAKLLTGPTALAPKTVADTRSTLRQVIESAVDHGLVSMNVVARVKAPRVEKRAGRVLDRADVPRLLAVTDEHRLGPAVAMLFLQGWRVSEVLGLAWQDVDLDVGTAIVRRAVVEVKGEGRRLGPPKTAGAEGRHELLPGVVNRLRRWKAMQAAERLAAGELWEQQVYDGERLDLVFTQPGGGLGMRQAVDKLIRTAATTLDLDPSTMGTHVGRRTVVTTLYAAGESSRTSPATSATDRRSPPPATWRRSVIDRSGQRCALQSYSTGLADRFSAARRRRRLRWYLACAHESPQ